MSHFEKPQLYKKLTSLHLFCSLHLYYRPASEKLYLHYIDT